MTLVDTLPRKTRGERILYVPKSLPLDHALVRAIGYPLALRLVRAYGGEILYPCACATMKRHERNRAIRERLKDASDDVVAREFGLTVRQIRNIKREILPEDSSAPGAQHSHTFESLVAA
jgi:hypothetical protein